MMILYSVRKKCSIYLVCVFCLCFVGLTFASFPHQQNWQNALNALRKRDVKNNYETKANSNDDCTRRATFYDYEWLKQADIIFTFLLISENDSRKKLQTAIKKDIEKSYNYPYIVSLSALSAGFFAKSDYPFVLSLQSILSQRIIESKPEYRWNFIYAFEQTIHCGDYSYTEIAEISKLIHSWHKLEFNEKDNFQLKHLMFSISGQMSGYFHIEESTPPSDDVWEDVGGRP